jgi:hypothetical protein
VRPCHHLDVPPEVTAGRVVVVVGGSVVVVVGGWVVVVPALGAAVGVETSGTVVGATGGTVVEEGGALAGGFSGAAFAEPGCSRATTAPISVVTPAAARMAVEVRRRILA